MAKEKSINEMRDEVKQLNTRAKEIIEKGKAESRKLNDEENKEVTEIISQINALNVDIATREAMNAGQGRVHTPQTAERFSLRRAIVAQMTGQAQREAESTVIAEAAKTHRSVAASSEHCGELIIPVEMRAPYTATTEKPKGVTIDEDQMELLLPLEANLVLSSTGARIMTGLVGNIYWPSHTDAKVFWEGENAEAKDGTGVFTKGNVFSPKRLTSYVDISKQLLIQENRSVEGLIRNLLAAAIAQKVEQTVFSNAAHTDGVPNGMFKSDVQNLGAITWDKIVKMETAADVKNALFGSLAYVMHPSLSGAAKTKVKDASGAGGFIIGDGGKGVLNGYAALRTNNIPDKMAAAKDEYGIVFGNWADYFLGQWGAIDITVDPYTQSTKGMVRLVVNSYWDMGVIRPESFTVASMK